MTYELDGKEVMEIQRLVREKLGECRKSNDIIGEQIFSLLSLYARVIRYPLGEKAPWGFTRLPGRIGSDISAAKPFVVLNSSIPVDCQVFAAAHELYHIWFERIPDLLPANLLDEKGKATNEKRANRFAAEFLVDELLLTQEIGLYQIETFTVKTVLQLAALFNVPYRVMARRLREIGKISSKELKELLEETEESLERYRKIYSIPTRKGDAAVSIDNLVELTVKAYRANLITFEKAAYLLNICSLSPEDVGIAPPDFHAVPTEAELDKIFSEESDSHDC